MCEQLLNSIKVSKLNYLVNETPYSAFITFRKKFTKDVEDLPNVTLVLEDKRNLDDVKKENATIKSKCRNLETELKVVTNHNSELKINLHNHVEENVKINQKLFILKGELANQVNALNKAKESNSELSKNHQGCKDKVKENQKTIQKVNRLMREKDDTIDMLNIIVENKKSELVNLKKELIDQKTDSSNKSSSDTFKCDQCEYTTESINGLKIHKGRMHEIKCDVCDEMFGGERKLKTHICRNHIENPTCGKLYTKSWNSPNECIRVFCNEQKKQLAIIHSKDCDGESPCPDANPKLIIFFLNFWYNEKKLSYNFILFSQKDFT